MIRIIGLPLVIVAAIAWAAGPTESLGTTGEVTARAPAARGLQDASPTANGSCDIASELPAFHFILEPATQDSANPDEMLNAWRTLTARVGQLGNEPSHERIAFRASLVEPPIDGQVAVTLKRIEDHQRATQLLVEVGLFEIVDPGPLPLQVGDDIRTPIANDEATPITVIDSRDVNSRYVHLVPDNDGRLVVVFGFNNPDASQRYAGFIENNLGEPIPVVVDNQVIALPTVTAAYPTGIGVVTGLDDLDASILAIELDSGPLPVPLLVVDMVPMSPAELCFG